MELNFGKYFKPESLTEESVGVFSLFPVVMLYLLGHMTDTGECEGQRVWLAPEVNPPLSHTEDNTGCLCPVSGNGNSLRFPTCSSWCAASETQATKSL